jgi:hypothetical protein
MFTDDIPRDWVGQEVACYTQYSSKDPHIGTLLEIGSESLLMQEDQDTILHNAAFVHRVVLRGRGEKKEETGLSSGSRTQRTPPPYRQIADGRGEPPPSCEPWVADAGEE